MFKPFMNLLCAAALANVALGQDVSITSPKSDSSVYAGAEVVVQLSKAMSLTASTEVAVVVGAVPCRPTCPNVADDLGVVLYLGPYKPRLYSDAPEPYENITVTIPSTYSGLFQFGVAQLYLIGAGNSAQLQQTNISLNAVVHQ